MDEYLAVQLTTLLRLAAVPLAVVIVLGAAFGFVYANRAVAAAARTERHRAASGEDGALALLSRATLRRRVATRRVLFDMVRLGACVLGGAAAAALASAGVVVSPLVPAVLRLLLTVALLDALAVRVRDTYADEHHEADLAARLAADRAVQDAARERAARDQAARDRELWSGPPHPPGPLSGREPGRPGPAAGDGGWRRAP
jgi:hypothetical protein